MMDIADDFVEFILNIGEFLSKVSPTITVIGIFITIIFAFRRKIVYKILKHIKKERLLTCIVIMNDLLNEIDIQELPNLLIEFRKEYILKSGMKETLLDLKNIIVSKEEIKIPLPILLSTEKTKKQVALIKNKKVWNELKKDSKLDKALDSVLNIFYERLRLVAATSNKKAGASAIKGEMSKRISKEQIEKNREKRFIIEEASRKQREKEKEIEMKEKKEKYYDMLNKKPL